jgi:hypothetical protein
MPVLPIFGNMQAPFPNAIGGHSSFKEIAMTAARVHQTGSCPNCGSRTLVEGRLLGQLDLGGGLAFRPKGRGFMGWLLRRDLSLPAPVFACAQCGLMWSFIKTKPLRRMIPPAPPSPATIH